MEKVIPMQTLLAVAMKMAGMTGMEDFAIKFQPDLDNEILYVAVECFFTGETVLYIQLNKKGCLRANILLSRRRFSSIHHVAENLLISEQFEVINVYPPEM